MGRPGILDRILPMAGSASTLPRRSPSMRDSIIAIPGFAAIEEATESILIPASCSTSPSRETSLTRCWATFLR